MASITKEGQELFNLPLWDEIGEDLGEITDLLINTESGEINFKSNGISKEMSFTYCGKGDFKPLIQCAYYVAELTGKIKKYKHSPETPSPLALSV